MVYIVNCFKDPLPFSNPGQVRTCVGKDAATVFLYSEVI
jgi:hypothetical protein